MQFDKALQVRRGWGNKPCSHLSIQKEYYLATATGDYVCTQCGLTHPTKKDFKKD